MCDGSILLRVTSSNRVAQEFASGSDRHDIFVATPLHTVCQLTLSDTASREQSVVISRRLCVMDVKVAFLVQATSQEKSASSSRTMILGRSKGTRES